jgi:hypothetical protein
MTGSEKTFNSIKRGLEDI